jgi:hypothetical protein
MFWIGFGLGLLVGGTIGTTIMVAMQLAARTDRQAADWHRHFGKGAP